MTTMRHAWICVLAACTGRHVEPAPGNEADVSRVFDGTPMVIPGERASYLLHVLDVPVGGIAVDLGPIEERDGRAVVWVTTLITSEGGIVDMVTSIRDEVSTCIDLESGIPIATRGSFVNLLSGKVDPEEHVEKPWGYQDREHLNGHTLLLSLRNWQGAPGDRAHTTLLSRTNSNEVELTYVGPEPLQTELGAWPSVRVDGRIFGAASNGDDFLFSLWMTDDVSRAPLRLDSDTDIGLRASARIEQYLVP